MKNLRLKYFSIISLALSMAGSAAAAFPPVRIGIVVNAASATLGAGSYSAESGGKKSSISIKEKTAVSVSGRRITVGSREWTDKVVLSPAEEGGSVSINGRLYRGKIELRRGDSGRVTVVNELPVDDYVRGILLHEVSPEWPAESLKAQCVISRTYALKQRGRHGSDGFDLCSQTHCQVYGGRSSERDPIERAVKATEGEVLLYQGQLVNAVFHSACGGATESNDNIWDSENGQPYLKTVRCRWCKRSPYYNWTADVRVDQIAKGLKAAGVTRVGVPKSLKVISRSDSGRAIIVRVTGSKGFEEMKSNKFRLAVDSRLIKSTNWTVVSTKRNRWKFSGHGWGHGSGLCQWGAKGQAESDRDYQQILRFYYQDVKLAKDPEL